MATDTNVDLGEIAKFEKLASRWWDPNSEFKPLHDINPLRAGWIDEHTGVMGKSVVDVGCGGGLLCEALAHRGASVTGIDMGEAPLAVARLHQLESGVEVDYLQSTAESLAAERPGATPNPTSSLSSARSTYLICCPVAHTNMKSSSSHQSLHGGFGKPVCRCKR